MVLLGLCFLAGCIALIGLYGLLYILKIFLADLKYKKIVRNVEGIRKKTGFKND